MAVPTYIVEAAFGYAPLGARVWTNITDAVRSMTLHRGKNHQLGRAEAGRASFKILNNDRRFDPSNTSSTFSPNVKLRTPIRVRVTYNAVTYNVWLGFVRRWYPTWANGVQSDTIVEATGLLDFIAGLHDVTLPGSMWEMLVRQTTSKRSWWRLGETAGATLAIDQVGGHSLTYAGTPTFGATALTVGSDDGAVNFAGLGSAKTTDLSACVTGADFTVIVWFQRGAGAAATERILAQDASSSWFMFDLLTTGTLSVNIRNPAGTNNVLFAGGYNDGLPHMAALTQTGGGNYDASVDGSGFTASVVGGAPGIQAGPVTVGGSTPSIPVSAFNGIVDEVLFVDRALSHAEITTLYNAGLGFPNDLTGTRIIRILDFLGITASDRAIDAGISTLQAETNLRVDAFTKLEEYRRAENAELFEGGDGKINFHSRQHRMVSPFNVSQATFSNLNGATNPIKAGGVAAPLDDVDVYNDIPVSRANGASYTASDQPSKDNNGAKSLPGFTGLPITSDLEVVDAANWLLGRFKDPRQRVGALVIDPFAKDATLFPQVLGREIGDRITVAHQPPGGGPAFTGEQIIESVDHVISVDGKTEHTTTWESSTADTTLYLIFDDAVSGRFDFGAMAY